MTIDRRTPNRITGADVAKEAGVSRATVSYVLNNTPNQSIPTETRERVLEAVARLGYAPSAAARTLAKGRSDIVIYLMPDLPVNATVGMFLERLGSLLAANGLTLLVRPWAKDAPPVTDLLGAVSPVALLVPDPLDARTQRALRAAGVRAVTPAVEHQYFVHAQAEIGRTQARTLIEAGHTSLAYALPEDRRVAGPAALRLAGVREVCAEWNLHEPESAVVALDSLSASETIAEWRGKPMPVTGVCAYDDDTALSVLAGLQGHGLDVPRDVALIGVDDVAAGRVSTPPLSTVFVDQVALADHAADTVIRALNGQAEASTSPLAAIKLIRRGSA